MKQTTKNQSTTPLVSVIMPVHNAAAFLPQAIESILTQTYKNIELIIINDCSTDGSAAIIKDYAKRYPMQIVTMKNCHHHHLAHAASKALTKAKGTFIARMDADDISLPTRIEKQVAYLQKHTDTVAVGTQCTLINTHNDVIGEKVFPTIHKEIYDYSFAFCPMQHPTIMVAMKRLPACTPLYNTNMHLAEDIEMIFKLMQYGKVANLSEHLFLYRMHETNITTKQMKRVFLMTLYARMRAVLFYGYKPSAKGILATLAQTMMMATLPNSAIMWLYESIRKAKLKAPMAKPTIALSLAKAV